LLLLAACENGFSSYPYYSRGPTPLYNPPPPTYGAPPPPGYANCGTYDQPRPCGP
jgi:hypothetical protein